MLVSEGTDGRGCLGGNRGRKPVGKDTMVSRIRENITLSWAEF